MGDMSIIAVVATILDNPTPTLFDTLDQIEVVTHDSNLKDALSSEFSNQITVSDPLNI